MFAVCDGRKRCRENLVQHLLNLLGKLISQDFVDSTEISSAEVKTLSRWRFLKNNF